MHTYNKGITELNGKGWKPVVHGEWIDAYNRTSNADGIAGTILTTISSDNMHWVAIHEEYEIKQTIP